MTNSDAECRLRDQRSLENRTKNMIPSLTASYQIELLGQGAFGILISGMFMAVVGAVQVKPIWLKISKLNPPWLSNASRRM